MEKKAIDFEHKKKEIEKRKKEEERSIQFRRGIQADMQVYRLYNSPDLADKNEAQWTETTFERVEKNIINLKFVIKVLLGFVICLAAGFTVYSSYMHHTVAEQKKTNQQLEKTVATEKKKEAFIDKLKKYDYDKQDEFFKFLDKNKIKYTVEDRGNVKFIYIDKGDTEYVVQFDDYNKMYAILTKVK